MVQAYTPGFFAVFFFLVDLAADGLGLNRRPATADETCPNSQKRRSIQHEMFRTEII